MQWYSVLSKATSLPSDSDTNSLISFKQQLDSKQTLSTEANVKQPKLSLHVLVSFLITSYDDGTKLTVNLLAIVVVSHAVCQLENKKW